MLFRSERLRELTYVVGVPFILEARGLLHVHLLFDRPIEESALHIHLVQPERMVSGICYTVDDRVELRLSEAYEHLAGEPDLELKVLMLNVNEGHNKDLMEQCLNAVKNW